MMVLQIFSLIRITNNKLLLSILLPLPNQTEENILNIRPNRTFAEPSMRSYYSGIFNLKKSYQPELTACLHYLEIFYIDGHALRLYKFNKELQ